MESATVSLSPACRNDGACWTTSELEFRFKKSGSSTAAAWVAPPLELLACEGEDVEAPAPEPSDSEEEGRPDSVIAVNVAGAVVVGEVPESVGVVGAAWEAVTAWVAGCTLMVQPQEEHHWSRPAGKLTRIWNPNPDADGDAGLGLEPDGGEVRVGGVEGVESVEGVGVTASRVVVVSCTPVGSTHDCAARGALGGLGGGLGLRG